MTTVPDTAAETLLTPAEVAALFRVDPKTVTRWARAGKLPAIRTLGGHRRYRAVDVRALLAAGTTMIGGDVRDLEADLATGNGADLDAELEAGLDIDVTGAEASERAVLLLPEPRVGA